MTQSQRFLQITFGKPFLLATFVLSTFMLPIVASYGQESGTELTATVVKKSLAIDVKIPGIFEAEDKDEYGMEPDEYRGDLIVTKILPEGTTIQEGDVLIEFDTAELDRAIEDANDKVADAEIALTKEKAAFQAAEIDMTAVLAQLQKELEMAQTGLEGEKEKQATSLKEKEDAVTDSERKLKRAQQDFEQLMQLYEERELHTNTENMLIQRQRESLEDSEKELQKKKDELEFFKKYELSKDTQNKEIEVSKKETELAKQQIQLEAELAEKKAQVAKAERKLTLEQDKVQKLEADKQALRIVSTRKGVLFYGTTGNEAPAGMVMIGAGGDVRKELRIGGRVKTHSILFTVASMEKLVVKMQVLENDIQYMKKNLPITIRPDAFPSLKLKGKLEEVDKIAQRTGVFSETRRFTVKGAYEGVATELRAGMNCQVIVHVQAIADAIQIPVVAVIEEGGKYFCYVKDGNQKSKREIKIGASNDNAVQITEGLRPGEIVYLSDPTRS